MKVSIVIPSYNHCDDLLRPCLESIIKHTDLEDVELIISANGCKDNTRGYLNLLNLTTPLKVIWNDEPIGYTKATNEGIKAATGDYIILLNNDTVILDQPKINLWIDMLLDPFKDKKVGITGPMYVFCPYAKKHFLIFFCVMIKRELFDTIGLLDEIFSPGFGEDSDFCIKAQNLGYKIVQVPDKTERYEKPNFMIGGFPIYHAGEMTFKNWKDGDKLLAERRFILMNRYNDSIKLNLGSGDRPMQGYFNIDISNPKNDLSWDVRKIPLGDCKVEEIVAIHLLEHFKIQEVDSILREWCRILKPEGKLILEFPNVRALFKKFETAPLAEKKHILDCVFGSHTPEFPHLYGWFGDTIWEKLNSLGFHNIRELPPMVEHWGINMRIECTKGTHLPEGFFGDYDIRTYRELLKTKVPVGGTIAELGCWKGRSLASVSDIIKERQIKVVVVDTFAGSVNEIGDQASPQAAKKEDVKAIFLDNMQKFGLKPELYHMTTHEASTKFEDGYFDMIFIDAEHTYKAVRQDVQDWWPKVKRGGVIVGHDCQWKEVADALTAEFGHLVQVDGNNIWWIDRHKVYDCFPFCNELDQLEIRMNELDKEVDYFVVVEGTETHSGKPKPLNFEANKERFRKFWPKIRYIIVAKWPEYIQGSSDSPWARERTQREAIMRGLEGIRDCDVVIMGDADEIPSAKAIRNYRRHQGMCRLVMKLYYYFINYLSTDNGGKWQESRIIPMAEFKRLDLTPCKARYTPLERLPKLDDAGWHFSFQGGVDEVIHKIQSYSHQEYNKPEIIERSRVERLIDEGKDVFGRGHMTYNIMPIDETYPQYIRDNLGKFSHMIRRAQKKVLVAMINYGTNNREYCRNAIKAFNSIEEYALTIKVFSTETNDFKDCEEIIIKGYEGMQFPKGIYAYLRTIDLSQWDYVLFTENDLIYTQENFDTFFKYENAGDFVTGFLVYEEKDGKKYLIHCGEYHPEKSKFEDKFEIVEYSTDKSFVRFKNCHQASWFLKSDIVARLLKFPPAPAEYMIIKNKGYLDSFEGTISNFYYSEKFPGSKYGVKKLIPIKEVEKLLVHHQPDKFVNTYCTNIPVQEFISERNKGVEVAK